MNMERQGLLVRTGSPCCVSRGRGRGMAVSDEFCERFTWQRKKIDEKVC